MSIKVMTRVWEHADCKGSELLVLLAMADFADDEGGNVFPSVATLAAKARLAERSIQYILRRLEGRGFIEMEEAERQHQARRYRVVVAGPGVQSLHPSETPGVQDETSRGAESGHSGVQMVAPKPSEEPPEEPSDSIDPDFAALEGEALAAWNDLAGRCGLARVQRLTDARRKKLRARLRECDGLEGWHAALAKIEGSSFLTGNNDRGWRADFDFVLQQSSFTKLMEGSYDDREGIGGGYSHARKTASMFEGINKAFERPDPAEAEGGGQHRPDPSGEAGRNAQGPGAA